VAGGGSQAEERTPANPGAGADVVVTVPAGEVWRLIGVHVDFGTNATVASREVYLAIRDAADMGAAAFGAPTIQAASNGFSYTWVTGGVGAWDRGNSNAHQVMGIGEVYLFAGWDLVISALNKQGGDAFTSCHIVVEKATPDVGRPDWSPPFWHPGLV
jgi:hypothetical protein